MLVCPLCSAQVRTGAKQGNFLPYAQLESSYPVYFDLESERSPLISVCWKRGKTVLCGTGFPVLGHLGSRH